MMINLNGKSHEHERCRCEKFILAYKCAALISLLIPNESTSNENTSNFDNCLDDIFMFFLTKKLLAHLSRSKQTASQSIVMFINNFNFV